MITIVNPTECELEFVSDHQLSETRRLLTYTDKQAVTELQRFKNAYWYISKHGQEAFDDEKHRLESLTKKCLLFQREDGRYWTYSGLASTISKKTGLAIANKVNYPEARLIPFAKPIPFELHYYQKDGIEALLKANHAGVEFGTGLGKSMIVLSVAKRLGLKTLIMAPSSNIANQLFDMFTTHFGKKYVGGFFGGKKESKKLFTIALPQSLVRIDKTNPNYKEFEKVQVFMADESHQCPASTLADVCFGLMKKAPYRFFFSATQMRNDGKDLLLEAITGPIVKRMSVKEGVDQGFLAKPIFKMVQSYSGSNFSSPDVNAMTRTHFYYNPKVITQAAYLINNFVSRMNHQTLVLIDEVEQFTKLLPYLEHKVMFAHGPLSENKAKVPAEYHDSDVSQLVKDFNAGKFPILVGTSCISTGTDIRNVNSIVYLMGGKSEIQTKQSVGRGTRIMPNKKTFFFVDFDVVNIPPMTRHASARREIYEDLYPGVEDISIQ